jgi:hypothetical protein
MFEHNLVKHIDLQDKIVDGKRYYYLPNGERFKSVTTVLSEKLDKSALERWKKRVGEEEANKISRQAAVRGTAVHRIAEKFILNDPDYIKGEMPSNIDTFSQIKRPLYDNLGTVLGVELPLYSRTLKTAGRADLAAYYNGPKGFLPSIIDFKTSKRLKNEEWIEGYLLQSTVYSMMFEYHYKIQIPQFVIIIAVDDEPEAQVFIKDRSQYVDRVIEIFTT